MDLGGKIIKPKSINKVQEGLNLDVSNINEGIYLLEIVSEKGLDKIKVIIER